ncbi:serine/threonine-protein kinase [Spatholobus suberectus]|nr:serine/threonine-protein kinase [Spatholobus suberectus]
MNPKSLTDLLPLLLLLLSLLPTITFSLDPKFEACEPKTCGNSQNISYPFYIQGTQQPFCGQPGFELRCDNSNIGFPILSLYLINTQYTVQKIFYNNHTLRLSNPAFSLRNNSSSCIAPVQNLVVSRYRYRLPPNQRHVFVFYGCDLAALPEEARVGRVGCDEENETASVVGLYREDRNLRLAWEKCKDGAVNATVEDANGGVLEALRRGFLLTWSATNCTECEDSGGRCGFDTDPSTYAFRCLCPDRPHVVKCSDTGANGLSKPGKIGVGLSAGLLCIFMIGLLLYCKRKHSSSSGLLQTRSTYSSPSLNPDVINSSVYYGVLLFSYKELEEATNRFDLNKQIGDGGFGTVYYGKHSSS